MWMVPLEICPTLPLFVAFVIFFVLVVLCIRIDSFSDYSVTTLSIAVCLL